MKFVSPFFAVFLLTNVIPPWIAEWIYPLDESSLWNAPIYRSLDEETERIQLSRRFASQDPRYIHKLIRLHQKGLSEGQSDPSSKARILTQILVDFEKGMRQRPVFPEYLVAFALLLFSASGSSEGLPSSLKWRNPLYLSDEKVEQALFLGYKDQALRAFAATYYQYRGRHKFAFHLWRSILTESPGEMGFVLEKCCDTYQDSSFLLDLAPTEDIKALTDFQETLLHARSKPWGKEGYLKTLPLLIEKAEQGVQDPALFGMIARSYQEMGNPSQAFLWYQKAFSLTQAPDSRAQLLLWMVEVLVQQGRLVETQLLLKKHLDLSAVKKEILASYAEISWNLGQREEAIKHLKTLVGHEKAQPHWRDQLASYLFEQGRYTEAADEWRTLLRETQGTPYGKDHRDRILKRILDCERVL